DSAHRAPPSVQHQASRASWDIHIPRPEPRPVSQLTPAISSDPHQSVADGHQRMLYCARPPAYGIQHGGRRGARPMSTWEVATWPSKTARNSSRTISTLSPAALEAPAVARHRTARPCHYRPPTVAPSTMDPAADPQASPWTTKTAEEPPPPTTSSKRMAMGGNTTPRPWSNKSNDSRLFVTTNCIRCVSWQTRLLR